MNLKKKALRVNTYAPMAAFAGNSPKKPDIVPIKSINIWELPEYVPPKQEPVRAGADDHLKIKSKGA
jgi:hypothetical protein